MAPTSRSALGEPPRRIDELVNQRVNGLDRLLGDLEKRLTVRRAIQLAPCSRSSRSSSTVAARSVIPAILPAQTGDDNYTARLSPREHHRKAVLPRPLPDAGEEPVPAISVVLPVYNEAAHVAGALPSNGRDPGRDGLDFELICVDDGSLDSTFAELERIHAADGRVRAVRLKRNFGQHAAMHAGLVRARGEILVTMDGDLQNSPEDIPLLVAAVEGGSGRGQRHAA